MFKKILLIFIFVSFLMSGFYLAQGCLAQGKELEIHYPEVSGAERPTTTKTFLPAYIEYIFTWAIIIAGLLAFFALVYGGILYLTSAGNPSKMSDAREQIIAGFLGLIILLSSFLILNTIDPQLVILEKPKLEQAIRGIYAYVGLGCADEIENYYDDKVIITQTHIPEISKWLPKDENKKNQSLKCIEFISKPENLTVNIFSDPNYGGTKKSYGSESNDVDIIVTKGTPVNISESGLSMTLDYYLPGVYLYSNSDTCGRTAIDGKEIEDIKIKLYKGSSATLPEFDNQTRSIKFIYGDWDNDEKIYKSKYSAILHEHENFMGQAMLFDQNERECLSLSENLTKNPNAPTDIGVSSITVYQKPIGDPIGNGVKFYEGKGMQGKYLADDDEKGDDKDITGDGYYKNNGLEKDLDIKLTVKNPPPPDGDGLPSEENFDNRATSMEMRGNYIALLFEHSNYKGDCEIFTKRNIYFRYNRIGQCGFWLARTNCLSSFIIKATR